MVSLANEVSRQSFRNQKLNEVDAEDLKQITIYMKGAKISSSADDLTASVSTCGSSKDSMVQIHMVNSYSEDETKGRDSPVMKLEMEEEPEMEEVANNEVETVQPDDVARQEEDTPMEEEPDLDSEPKEGAETDEKPEVSSDASPKRCYAKVTAERRASLTGAEPPAPIPADNGKTRTLTHRDSIKVGMDRAPPTPTKMRARSILKSSADSLTNTKSSSSSSSRTTRLKFDSVVIREYSMTLGDHPNCSIGPPVSLDWEYEEFHPLDLDEYESVRGQRRTLRQMMLNYYQRKHLFENVLQYPKEDIKACEKAVSKAKRQREITRTFLPVRKVEEVAQSATRKFKRVVVKRKERMEAPVVAF